MEDKPTTPSSTTTTIFWSEKVFHTKLENIKFLYVNNKWDLQYIISGILVADE